MLLSYSAIYQHSYLFFFTNSERVKGNGSTSQRFREGLSINKSLSALGNVIRALAESSTAKNPTTLYQISYRDSALTKLLMNALEGNSKTIMVHILAVFDLPNSLNSKFMAWEIYNYFYVIRLLQ